MNPNAPLGVVIAIAENQIEEQIDIPILEGLATYTLPSFSMSPQPDRGIVIYDFSVEPEDLGLTGITFNNDPDIRRFTFNFPVEQAYVG